MKQLIVIDMQNDFVTGVLANEGAKNAIPLIAEKIQNAERPVIFTRDTHFDNYMDTMEGKKLPVPHCIEGTEGHKIVPELLAVAKNAIVVDKYTFGFTHWNDVLGMPELNNIDEIEIVGTVNPICPIANAIILRAYYPNMKITMDLNACGFMGEEDKEVVRRVLTMQQIDFVG